MRGQSYVILAIIFVIIVAVFAVINVDPVEVNYLFGSGEAPLILVILFSVLMGGIITASVGLIKMIHLQRERKYLLAENNQLKESVEEDHTTEVENKENPDAEQNNL
ncbi:LapA family protein [Virgibacillus litoralis]|uniref:Integral membrane protein n=1 Tax=Virgibacillus litoralis TaxID=578221 RepID=A0ABS4H9R1_9BACI|nr:lipopolysaccharide assembly protein LapA domain-containing protein [Virgibacillus litoralis]MBP1947646.1 putative integral membrane protein [Virgibacillus litoralis]